MPQPIITAARTARLDLPYLFPGQSQKEAFVNEALARLDALVQPSVIDERNDPPTDAVRGDSYLVGRSPTGEWVDNAGAIAVWAENQWLLAAPLEGMAIFDRAAGSIARYFQAVGWSRAEAPPMVTGGAVPDAELRAAFNALVESLRTLGFFA